MAPLKVVISLLLLSFSLQAAGFASYDDHLGLFTASPFTPPYLGNTTPLTTFETGVTNHYSADISADTRYISTYWGALWGEGRHRFSTTLTYFSAFSLLQEMTPNVGYAFRLTPRCMVGGSMSYTIHWADTLSQSSCSPSLGLSWRWGKISTALEGTWGQLELGHEQPADCEGEIRILLRAEENLIGSQGFSVLWDFLEDACVFSLVECFSLTPWWKISLGIKSSPMLFYVGSAWEVKRSQFGILMSRHPELGWSTSLTFQWHVNRSDTSVTRL